MKQRVWVKDMGLGTVVPCGDQNYTFVDMDDGQEIAIRVGDRRRQFVFVDVDEPTVVDIYR